MVKKSLILITFLALVLRLWGIQPGFPPYHPDEPQVYSRALLILQNKEEELGYWGYPALVPLIHAVLYRDVFIPTSLGLKFIENPSAFYNSNFNLGKFLETNIYGRNHFNVMFWGRAVNALLGSLTVLFTFLLG